MAGDSHAWTSVWRRDDMLAAYVGDFTDGKQSSEG